MIVKLLMVENAQEGDDYIDNPTWEVVEEALNKMDGETTSYVSFYKDEEPNDEEFLMVGGGVDGKNYVCCYWNDGDEKNAGDSIRDGADTDGPLDPIDASGANLRYRHGSEQANAIFADGHVERFKKGKVRDRNVYTNY